mmetsp:Transcript_39659/g.94161  ORF Transcript_39659/g.94161 Transcript_39659/m.94161 type:complete len:243 (-) Transcript_39659:2285-3013(-)
MHSSGGPQAHPGKRSGARGSGRSIEEGEQQEALEVETVLARAGARRPAVILAHPAGDPEIDARAAELRQHHGHERERRPFPARGRRVAEVCSEAGSAPHRLLVHRLRSMFMLLVDWQRRQRSRRPRLRLRHCRDKSVAPGGPLRFALRFITAPGGLLALADRGRGGVNQLVGPPSELGVVLLSGASGADGAPFEADAGTLCNPEGGAHELSKRRLRLVAGEVRHGMRGRWRRRACESHQVLH